MRRLLLFICLALCATTFQVLCTGTQRPGRSLDPAGSRSPSPSRPKPTSPARNAQGVKLFGVVIHEAPKEPVRLEHPSQSQTPHIHAADPGRTSKHTSQSTASRSPAHGTHAHPLIHLEQPKPIPRLKRLGSFVAGLHPGDAAPSKRPAQTRAKWWQKEGGKPARPHGSGPFYEEQKKYREMKKAEKQQGKHTDDHPSVHQQQPPKGDGPGSPGAGSNMVGKRRLIDTE